MHGFSLSRGLFWAAILFLLVLTAGPWLERLWISSQAEPRAVTARGELAGDERATIEIFESVSPSVVFITTTEELMSPWTRNLTEVRRGTGSGFVWDDDGHVVTNWHVIADAQSARVRLADQRSYPAELIGASPEHDLAVLRIGVALARPHPVPIGTSADLKVGQKVFAIGNPFGFDYSLTTGVVSALDRTIYADDGAEGVLVLRVEPQSPADRAGLVGTRVTRTGDIVPGDIIQRIDGQPVSGMGDLIELLEDYEIGDQVTLSVLRNRDIADVQVTLGGQFQQLD